MGIVKHELAEVRANTRPPRRTEILDWDSSVEDEDLIQREDMVVTVSHAGYIKRVLPLSTYRAQRRGGKGRAGMSMRDEDFVTRLFVRQHPPRPGAVLLLAGPSLQGERCARLPLAAPNARGQGARLHPAPRPGQGAHHHLMPLPEDGGVLGKRST